MAGSFSQIYIQIVFAVRGRDSLIGANWEEELYQYITGIVRNKEQKMPAINGMPDHIHLFIGIKPSCCLSDLVREIKKSSNEFINGRKFCGFRFHGCRIQHCPKNPKDSNVCRRRMMKEQFDPFGVV